MGEEDEDDDEQQEADEDLDNYRMSVVASRMSAEPHTTFYRGDRTAESDPSRRVAPHVGSKDVPAAPITGVIVSSPPRRPVPPIPKQESETTLNFERMPVVESSFNAKRISALRILKPPTTKAVSALTQMVDSTDSTNPFARDFSFFVSFSKLTTCQGRKSRCQSTQTYPFSSLFQNDSFHASHCQERCQCARRDWIYAF